MSVVAALTPRSGYANVNPRLSFRAIGPHGARETRANTRLPTRTGCYAGAMTDNFNRRLGDACERAAADYLIGRGYRIAHRNFRTRRGEVDLIAMDGEVIVFVEVKARRGRGFGTGRDALDARKQARLLAIGAAYAANRPPAPLRFDVIEVSWQAGRARLCHLIAAFP